MAYRLAASAEMLFTDLPFVERVREISSRGFEIEIWDWTQKNLADVPGRMEPGTGEIYYQRIAQELRAIGYDGVVGLEAFASGDSVKALEAFADAFA